MTRLAALVVTHNRIDQLKLTVARFLEARPEDLETLLVVDNASTDQTSAWLEQQTDPRLRVLRLARNTGGAGGFAAGMSLLCEEYDHDWLLLSDDDGWPAPGALEAFHGFDHTGWDALAAAVYTPAGELCEMNRPSRNPFSSARRFRQALLRGRDGFHINAECYRQEEPTQVDVTSFVGFFIRRGAIAKAGLPDPGLFLYADDGIYTFRLSQQGGRIGFVPQIRFTHDLTTFAGQNGRFHPIWKLYYYHRNLLMLYRQVAGIWFWPVMLLVLPKWGLKARVHMGAQRAFTRLMVRAIHDGLRGRTYIPHADVLRMAEPPPAHRSGVQNVAVVAAHQNDADGERRKAHEAQIPD